MKHWLKRSFRNQIFATMMVSILLLVFLCNVLIMQLQVIKTENHITEAAQEQLDSLNDILTDAFSHYASIAASLQKSPITQGALSQHRTNRSNDSRLLWQLFFQSTEDWREYAQFDIYDTQGYCRYTTSSTPVGGRLPTGWGILYAASQADTMVFHSTGSDYDVYETLASDTVFLSVYAIRLYDQQIQGYLVVSMTQEHFNRLFHNRYSFSNLLLLDAQWHTIYCSQSFLQTENLVEVLRTRFLEGKSIEDFDETSYSFLARNETSGFYLILQQPRFYTSQALGTFRTITVLMSMLCLPICLLCSLFLSRHLAKPVQDLDRAMAQIQQGNFDIKLERPGEDEFSRLTASFNRMTNEYQNNLKRQQALNETQLRMLHAQLNPHFLYNTLDSMKWLAVTHDAPELASLATDLAILLRASISADELITLADELEFLDRYIEIQSIRFTDSFSYETDIDPCYYNCLIPKLTLQAIVENSILYGVSNREDGYIKLTARQEGEDLILSVFDNGCGIPEDILEWLNREEKPALSGHTGLFNVNQIICLHYGKQYGLSAESKPQEFSCIKIRLPINKKEDMYV